MEEKWDKWDSKNLIGKTVIEVNIDGYEVHIKFSDGTEFDYYASDAGYSSWEIINSKTEEENKDEMGNE